ncbi:MAG: hypothetical protein D6772_00275 [Bacteroidetes bacterium]|nr:MAG: hypothetical protein D6772_00275 [Bacteroidota bacterium]
MDGVEISDGLPKQVSFPLDVDYLTFSIQENLAGGFTVQTETKTSAPTDADTHSVIQANNADISYTPGLGSGNHAEIVIIVDDTMMQLQSQTYRFDLAGQTLTLYIKLLSADKFEHKLWTKKL